MSEIKKSSKEEINKFLNEFASKQTVESEPVTYGPFTLVFRSMHEEEMSVRDRFMDFSNTMTITKSYVVASMAISLCNINGQHIEDFMGYSPVDKETGKKKTLTQSAIERYDFVTTNIFNKMGRDVVMYMFNNGYKPLEDSLQASVQALDKKKSLSLEDDGADPLLDLSEDTLRSIIPEPIEL